MFKSYPPMIDPEIFEGLMKKQQLAVNFGDLLNDDIFHNTEFLKKATNISDFMEGFQNSINILPSIKYLQNTNLLSDAFRQSTINAMNIGTNFKKDFFQNNQFKNFSY
ncbi:hypothetical protein JCM21714_1965 [Gracilibacillus boraciitolerans JCM 21714]|uniref:Uncharacterized protein n=2 Tax=Gracilibacillus boraciitolerans TaxID=307521 RepID=W4VJL1_9BACI|nr:hypothetical protein JCM21714_1965 [Gracilibacillus boraciitolerans JCM 21714]